MSEDRRNREAHRAARQQAYEDAALYHQVRGEPHATGSRAATWDDRRGRYVNEKGFWIYGCAKRGCDAVNLDFEVFGVGDKSYCLHHIPLLTRLRLRGRIYD